MLVMSCLTGLADLFRRTASPPSQRRAAPLVSSPHPLAPTAAWPGRASEGRAACCSRGGFRARWHSAKPLAHLSVSFSGWNEGSVGCSDKVILPSLLGLALILSLVSSAEAGRWRFNFFGLHIYGYSPRSVVHGYLSRSGVDGRNL